MKRMLCFAALAVLLWSSFAMAADSVVVQSLNPAPSQAGVVIGVRLTNDANLLAVVVPLTIRSITPGAFITALTATSTSVRNAADRLSLTSGTGALQGIKTTNRYNTPDGNCKQLLSGGFKTPVAGAYAGPWTSPAAVLMVCAQFDPTDPGDPLLATGSDITAAGSLKLTVSVTSTPGCFEIDTTCTNPANHLAFSDENNTAVLPSFTKGLITIGTPPNAAPVSKDTAWTTGMNTPKVVTYLPGSDADAWQVLTFSISTGPAHGVVTGFIPGTGEFTYTPTTGYLGLDSLKFTVCDNSCPSIACVTKTVRVTVATVNNPPVAQCQNKTVDADSTCHAPASIDNGSYDPDAGNTITLVQVPPGPYALGQTAVQLIVTDNLGAADTCAATVTVQDKTKPKIACPADTTFKNNDANQCGAIVSYALTATDNCSTPTLVYSPVSGSFLPVGVTTVRAIATDGAGNADTCFFKVKVRDTQKPVVTCPSNVLANNDPGQCGAVVSYAAPGVSDNCPSVTFTALPASGSTFPAGVTPVKVIATDASGNKDSCSFNVTVSDTSKPTIACPSDINVNNDAGLCGATVTFGPPQASDNCPGATAVSRPASGSFFAKGSTTVYWVATDAAGNKDSCSFHVIVADNEKPHIACPADTIYKNNDADQCGAIVTFALTATDNCSTPTLAYSPVSGSFLPVGVTTVRAIATDGAAIADTCFFKVKVRDAQKPGVSCPATVNVDSDSELCSAIATFPDPVVLDNCPGVSYTVDPLSGSTFLVGTTPVKIVATDASGNKDSCSFNVIVHDTTKPVIHCTGDIPVNNDPGQCGATVSYSVGAWDNCAVNSIVHSPPSGTFFPPGNNLVRVVATDLSGNTDTCFFHVIVSDTEKPTLTCPPSPYAATIPAGHTSGVVNYDVPVTDNCLGVGKVLKPPSGSTFNLGDSTVWCVATDVAGNKDSCSFTVHVVAGNSPPILDSIGPKTVTEGTPLSFNVQARDADGDGTITLSRIFPPSGSTLTPTGPGAGTFDWTPTCSDGGSVFHLKIIASDGALADTENVDITVIDKPEHLVADLDSIVIHYQKGSPIPAPIDVALSDSGCSGHYAWQANSSQAWLIADPDSGTTPSTVHVSIDTAGLTVGPHDATLTFGPQVSSLSANNVGIIVKVHLTVGPTPHDSVWVTSGSGKLGDTVAVDVNFYNNHVATGITVGLHYPSSNVRVVDYSFAGSRVAGLDYISADTSVVDEICLSAVAFTPDHWIPEGSGKLATLRFRIASLDGCPGPLSAVIDSVTVGIGCGPLLTDTMLAGVYPSFVSGAIDIVCPGHICGVVQDTSGNLLAGAVVQLWDAYPGGQVLDDTTTLADGQFCFEDLDRNGTFDLRIYRVGYCTQIIHGAKPHDIDLLQVQLVPLPVIPGTPAVAFYSSTNAKISGVPLMVGDVFTAFDPDGVMCGKTMVEAPGTYLIAVVGDDIGTVGKDEGAETGDQITFYLNCTCPLLVPTPWVDKARTEFDAEFDCGQRKLRIPLCDSWTLFSFNVLPADPSREAVLDSIDGQYNFVFTLVCPGDYQTWNAAFDPNSLDVLDPFHGYWIKPNAPGVGPIVLSGAPMAPNTPLNLCLGWNLISYLPDVPDTFTHALSSIDGQYDRVLGYECGSSGAWKTWDANRPADLNDLGCMKPLGGYWVRTNTSTTLTYPVGGYACNDGNPTLSKPVNLLTRVTPTPWVTDFWSAAPMSATGLNAGDRLTARTKAGVICGECLIGQQGAFMMHVYGDDPTTKDRVEGAVAGEVLRFEVNDSPATVEAGSSVWSERQSLQVTITLAKSGPLPTGYALLQNYPNPFNPSTVIMFRLPVAADAKLTIYNVLGQTVRQLFSGSLPAGDHSFEWNGQDQNGRTVQSGIYFYRLDTPSWSSVKKMTFLK